MHCFEGLYHCTSNHPFPLSVIVLFRFINRPPWLKEFPHILAIDSGSPANTSPVVPSTLTRHRFIRNSNPNITPLWILFWSKLEDATGISVERLSVQCKQGGWPLPVLGW